MRAENGAYLGHYEAPEPKCEICGRRDCPCWYCEICREVFEEPHDHCSGCRMRTEDCMCIEEDDNPGIVAAGSTSCPPIQPGGQHDDGADIVTYETEISIEIAGTRRSIPLEFEYRVATINGRPQTIHDAVSVVCGKRRFAGQWIYDAMGIRQLEALDARMLAQWNSEARGAA